MQTTTGLRRTVAGSHSTASANRFTLLPARQIVVETAQRGDLLNVQRLMFDRPSLVTVVALTRVVAWVLERDSVHEALSQSELARVSPRELFLHSVPLLANLSTADFLLVAEHCTEVAVAHGDRVVHQGETAEQFFIVMEGEAVVSQAGALSARASARVSETKARAAALRCPPAPLSPASTPSRLRPPPPPPALTASSRLPGLSTLALWIPLVVPVCLR